MTMSYLPMSLDASATIVASMPSLARFVFSLSMIFNVANVLFRRK